MAMLASPRRKQKVINLRAKNNAWSNDATKFGQRMLERMGWESGKGLGAREQGTVEHVIARYKNDEAGLGYQERTDQWTQHEDQFNALLADLSNGSTGGGGEETEGAAHSGVSLEVKSKRSRVRVHYHKFTRGKDLSRYSRKELANIFGKKSLNLEPLAQHQDNAAQQTAAALSEPAETQTLFKAGGSMLEYFQRKMKSLSGGRVESAEPNLEPDCSFRGFAGTEPGDRMPEFSEYSCYNQPLGEDLEGDIAGVENVERKKKKKKKKADADSTSVDNVREDNFEKSKQKAEAKSEGSVAEIEAGRVSESEENDAKMLKKRKKKLKADSALAERHGTEESSAECTVSTAPSDITSTKKKKSKRKSEVNVEGAAEVLETERPPEKKSKKSKLNK